MSAANATKRAVAYACSTAPSPSATPAPDGATCEPSGTKLKVVAMNSVFDSDCLAVPAGDPFSILFENHDPGIPHNLSIYTDESATQVLFTGELVTGPGEVTERVRRVGGGHVLLPVRHPPDDHDGNVRRGVIRFDLGHRPGGC